MRYNETFNKVASVFLLGLLFLAVANRASAQLGTTNSPFGNHENPANTPEIFAQNDAIYPGADYLAGGVGLRNQLQRSIILSGTPTGPTTDALIYWSVLGPVKAQDKTVTVARLKPAPTAAVTVLGDEIAVGKDPCWGSDGNHIYRAHVPITVVSGTGDYLVTFATGAGGLSNGEDPWDGTVTYPLMEGAAIVAITRGSKIVTVFHDQAGLLLSPPSLSYNLNLLVPTLPNSAMKFTTIGADGQVGTSVNADLATSQEETFIDNFPPFPKQLAGYSCKAADCDSDSDWNGNSAAPLPQLFDVTTHGFTLVPGGFNALHVHYTSKADCTNIIANVVSQQF
jgi:hypothetical protein